MPGMTAANDIAAALRTQAFAGVQEGIFYNNEVMTLFDRVPMTGGSTFNYKHHSAGATASTYVEGDALGSANTQTYATSQYQMTYYKRVIQITGHARDQLRNGSPGAAFFDQIALEAEYAMKEIVDLASTDMLGTGLTTPVGLQGICDSAGTLAGIDRSSATWFQAYEVDTAGSGLAMTDLDIVWGNVHDANYASPGINMILTSWTQVRIAKGLSTNWGSNNPYGLPNTTAPVDFGQGMGIGAGRGNTGMFYSGAPIIAVRDLTSTVWLFLRRENVRIAVQRGMTVDPLAKTDDSDKFLLTWAGAITADNPRYFAKLTGA